MTKVLLRKHIEIQFELQFNYHDLWTGLYWEHNKRHEGYVTFPPITDLYFILIPMLPLHIRIWWAV
jgi:hypothetical protein